ncbi:MAG: ATP-binding protein [Chloroflexi bacterium]|nr:ATP-binding protein [Chloroflexota bacterium]MCL5274732.1 ATP-binding protein [Chloroflexota bacterium]
MTRTRRLVVPAQNDQLAKLATFVASAAVDAGFNANTISRIELAVDEACSNIIDHAYAGAPGAIRCDVTTEPLQQLTIVLVDQGRPFNPDLVPEYEYCRSLNEAKIGGLGLHLMRQVMDDVCFEFSLPGVGNRLTMVKHYDRNSECP